MGGSAAAGSSAESTPNERRQKAIAAEQAAIVERDSLQQRLQKGQGEQERVAGELQAFRVKLAQGDIGISDTIAVYRRRAEELQDETGGVATLLQQAEQEVTRLTSQRVAAVAAAQRADLHESLERERAAAQRLIPALRHAIAKSGELFGEFADSCDQLDALVAQLPEHERQPFNEWRPALMNELGVPYPSGVTRYLLASGWQPKLGGGWGANYRWELSVSPLRPPTSGKGDAE